ncbi:hypothetical protein RyT2_24080 [Pseudolactococcus yaeyamensis]
MAIGNDLDTYHQDGLKSNITQISKENGRLYSSNLYKEFGSSERRINDQAGYRSQYHDNSADIHLRAREYNTTTGRFLQQDTVLGDLENPVTQNKYIYGNNNPFMYRDDAGRFGWNDVWNGIKKAAKKAVQIVDNYVVKPAVKAVKYVANAVGNFVSNVFHSAQQVYNQAASYASQGVNYVSNQVQQGYNQAVDWAATKAAQAQAAYQQAVAIAQETRAKAEARIRKMCEGASAVWNGATKAVGDFVKKHENAIKIGLSIGAGILTLIPVTAPLGMGLTAALTIGSASNVATGKDWLTGRELSNVEKAMDGLDVALTVIPGAKAVTSSVGKTVGKELASEAAESAIKTTGKTIVKNGDEIAESTVKQTVSKAVNQNADGLYASSPQNKELLNEFYRQAEENGKAGIKELDNGKYRFYDDIKPAMNEGEMKGARPVKEWDPDTGNKRSWYETVDHNDTVRSVAPKPETHELNHHIFDADGNYLGRR